MRNASITRHVSSLNDLLRSIQIVGKGATAVLKSIIENIGGKECVHDEMDCTTSEQIGDIDSESLQELLVAGLLDLCKLKLVGNDAIKWLGDWLIANNPKKLNRSDPEKMQSDIDPSLK